MLILLLLSLSFNLLSLFYFIKLKRDFEYLDNSYSHLRSAILKIYKMRITKI